MDVLYVNACVRDDSRTNILAQHVLSKLDGEIVELKLGEEDLKPLTKETLMKKFDAISKGDYSDLMFKYAKQFIEAKTIVIGAPYWDLSFPALLKTYIENVNVLGIVFNYGEDGLPKSNCNAKKLIYVTSSGGPIINDETGYGYIKTLCNALYNIPKTYYIKAQGLDIAGADIEAILEQAKKEIDETDFV